MTLPPRFCLAAALGLGLACRPAAAEEPAPLPALPAAAASANQETANAIAASLRHSGQIRRYSIDIVFHDGTAELTGVVADGAQRDAALRLAGEVPGVERVVDRLTLAAPIQRVQAADPLPEPEPGAPDRPRNADAKNALLPEPTPEFAAPRPQASDLNPPKMPPYAWPTYAPYNNFSRVACPEGYPYNAWPFIGPPYPFPKVPLSWRKVTLEWDDGHWWFSKVATKHDWWRLRYW